MVSRSLPFEHHLKQYTRRNTSDFFIHKDLKGFLVNELDFYLKNEVLVLNEIEAGREERAEGWFQMMRTIRSVGSQIIEFLNQIENFQKLLWEKRKFVTETHYCIAVGHIDSRFYDQIAQCETQWEEWQELLDLCTNHANLFNHANDSTFKRVEFMKNRPTLPLDTKHFDGDFVDCLLGSYEDLDGMTDGLLIQSENWQALNLLTRKHSGQVKCVYIDPPYNTGDSEILYKNGYLRSSWLTLIENRLSLASRFLTDDPVVFVAIDDFEMVNVSKLVDVVFNDIRREMIIVNHHPQGGKAQTLACTHEYMLACVSNDSGRRLKGRTRNQDVENRPFMRSGTAESNFRYGRPNSFYAILVEPNTYNVMGIEPPPKVESDYPIEPNTDGFIRVYPVGKNNQERVWRRSYESCHSLIQENSLLCTKNHTIYQKIDSDDRTTALFSNWTDKRYNAGTFGANVLGDILGQHNAFPYPKSIHTVGDALFAVEMGLGEVCLDYFAGSGTTGHAVINLNREDGGQRKFILVEMGEHFDDVMLPRTKKVTYTPVWKDGKPSRVASPEEAGRSPRIIKYMRLESYEDALNNIDFDSGSGQNALQFDDYLLKYTLYWETKHSTTLLNVEKLTSPFHYSLDVNAEGQVQQQTADIPETFNYLLGIYIESRRVYYDMDRRYLVFRGKINQRRVVVIWRETQDWVKTDLERDRVFVDDMQLTEATDEVYVNGDSLIHGAKALEPLFKRRMFAEVG